MYSKFFTLFIAAASLALAQGPHGPQPGNPVRSGYGLDMSKVQTIEGAVTAINIGYGTQYPSIQVNQVTIKVAPAWFLLDRDFEVKAGEKLKVTAAPSLQAKDPYLNAITLTNTTSGATVTLRDANGLPLWTQLSDGPGDHKGYSTCNPCLSSGSIAVASGTVDQVSAGIGIQMPTLVFKTADGKVLTVKIRPERILEAADFEIKAGDTLTVRYANNCLGETVALEMIDAAGVKLVLRNDDGTPAWK